MTDDHDYLAPRPRPLRSPTRPRKSRSSPPSVGAARPTHTVAAQWTPVPENFRRNMLDWWQLAPPRRRRRERPVGLAIAVIGVLCVVLGAVGLLPTAYAIPLGCWPAGTGVYLAVDTVGVTFVALSGRRRMDRRPVEMTATSRTVTFKQGDEEHSYSRESVRPVLGSRSVLLVLADSEGGFVPVPLSALEGGKADALLAWRDVG